MVNKKRILIIGDSPLIMQALEQYVLLVPDMADYEVVDTFQYGGFMTQKNLEHVDLILCDLFRCYGTRLRAEGIPTAKTLSRFPCLIYGFNVLSVAKNPCIWNVVGEIPLAKKLRELANADRKSALAKLEKHFSDNIFPVDGHK